MASPARRGSIGLDGAESKFCDLSVRLLVLNVVCANEETHRFMQGRGLTVGQVDRTLRVFATADTIDLSNNEIDKIPASIPSEVVTLDISFNSIASIQGIERLKFVQELHLAFNRLDDVSALEFCPQLVRVNLSGNRLFNTKGLETLEFLENLDMSDNLIEFPEALRALSLNQNLTHLTIRGNPLSQKPGYHVPMLDMIPSLLMLDDKKMRSTTKYKTKDVSTTKSLSYSRIYDDKKQFVIHKQIRPRPATTVQPLLPGDAASKYDGTMFLPPPIEPTHERARAALQKYQYGARPISPPPAPLSPSMSRTHNSPSKHRTAPYLSMYDRLAQSNGIPITRPITPTVKPIPDPNPQPSKPDISMLTRLRGEEKNGDVPLQKSANASSNDSGRKTTGVSTPRNSTASRKPISRQEPQQQHRAPPNANGSSVRRSSIRSATPTPTGHVLDDKQRNVLSVIQNLIEHKRQTLATLGNQKTGTTGNTTPSREYNLAGQSVR
ncbi:Nischarin [Phytophthora citrophthora]|uniref:Nischarin n=1 Tax=Phytophthora citrophthora TaxID=4793 RepID=A0AAD9G626_9STRA|nr:Nischarin [Phytophthora citrophthora]